MFNTVRSPPGVDDVVDDDYDDRDTSIEVQTNFVPSQNFAMIVKFTIIIFHPASSYNTKIIKTMLVLVVLIEENVNHH